MPAVPRRRVLVVDDDDDIRLLLEELLRGAGYAVETAEDGRAALRAFHETPADVVKPFGRQELLARIEALLRRAPEPTHLEHYDDGAISIDYARRLVLCRGLPVRLTPLEFRLLAAFTRHPGEVLSAEQLIEHCWGHEGGAARDQVKLYVSHLRKKLGQVTEGFEPIETVRGFGYRYVPPSG